MTAPTRKIRLDPAVTAGRLIAATGQTVAAGEVVDVPAGIAERLLDQDIWAEPATTGRLADPEEGTP